MIDYLRRLFGMFDSTGLKYSMRELCEAREEIPFWPIDQQAKYADKVCVRTVKDKDFLIEQFKDLDVDDHGAFQRYNTTAVGNMAYIALHSDSDTICRMATEWLTNLKQYKTLETLEVSSDFAKGFEIKYLETKDPSGKILSTPARVSNQKKVIEINKAHPVWKQSSRHYKYFLMRWCVHMHYRQDMLAADIAATKDYIAMGFSNIELLASFSELTKNPIPINVERLKQLTQLLIKQNEEVTYKMDNHGQER
ncbi:hypothetical protein L0152_20325 [bacterium]|nr:hypothetical protein [bacterium]